MHHQHKHTHKRANSHTDQQPGLSCKASHAHTHFKKHTLNFLLTHFPNNTPPLSFHPSLHPAVSPSLHPAGKQSRAGHFCSVSPDQTTHTHTPNQIVYEAKGMQGEIFIQTVLYWVFMQLCCSFSEFKNVMRPLNSTDTRTPALLL